VNVDEVPIAAIATAPGRGGIGIVRVSGSELEPVLLGVLGARRRAALRPREALLAHFLDAQGAALDQGLVLYFPGPHSYTGESVLELHAHGGGVVLRQLLARILELGAGLGLRIAQPGEFTRRAYLNNRLDLAQAEAVADLIDASSVQAARGALRSLQGEFSRTARHLAAELTELRALTEATLDFPEEEIDFLKAADAGKRLAAVAAQLEEVRRRARQGAVLREGVRVVLVGAPNVGKSSLLNALAGEEAAIVTEFAGTTRDRIERTIEIEGLAVSVIDTAGLRETQDPVEAIGIARTLEAAAQADCVLELRDDTAAGSADLEPHVRAHLAPGTAHCTVHNKIDLSGKAPGVRDGVCYVSARTGAGLEALRSQLLAAAGWEAGLAAEGVFLARARHLHALERAAGHLVAAQSRLALGNAQLELFAEELRLAANALGEITGSVSSDALLGEIFGRFCLGK